MSLTLLPALGTLFLLLACLVQPKYGLLPCLIVSLVLFDCHLLEACHFLKRKWRGKVFFLTINEPCAYLFDKHGECPTRYLCVVVEPGLWGKQLDRTHELRPVS